VCESQTTVVRLSKRSSTVETRLFCQFEFPIKPALVDQVHLADHLGNSRMPPSQVMQFLLFRRREILGDASLFQLIDSCFRAFQRPGLLKTRCWPKFGVPRIEIAVRSWQFVSEGVVVRHFKLVTVKLRQVSGRFRIEPAQELKGV